MWVMLAMEVEALVVSMIGDLLSRCYTADIANLRDS